MNVFRRFWGWLDPTHAAICEMREQDRATEVAFRSVVDQAEPGSYFRTLARAVQGSAPYGQPVDFRRLVEELAVLEQRVADLEP